MNYERKNKLKMWYKVQELTEQGYNKSQIKLETGLDRATIRRYQQIDEEAFHNWIQQKRNLPKRLFQYKNYVKEILGKTPYLSAAQVEDWLKEKHDDLPDVHSKTVYNFVQSIREEFNIPKPTQNKTRQFEKLPETAYGQEAQVDFGETWMQTKQGNRKKVYFFALSLSRSRYKYIYLTDTPFTSKIAIEAHHLAFDYFEGVPKEIIYDQDSVFIHNENLGDYLLTKEFSAFCKTQDFKAVFCRKADPQSKGKIENVVKYVKQNFLRGREYVNIGLLNTLSIAWLERTANAKVHSATKLVPKQEWLKEKQYLLPIKQKHITKDLLSYNVRKDNTILFASNFYSLPLGTYINSQSKILLEINQEEVLVFTTPKNILCKHKRCFEKGKTIRNTDHKRPKSETLEILHKQVFELLGASELVENYLQMLHKDKTRYYRDNLQYILKNKDNYGDAVIKESLMFCIENKVFNAKNVIDILNTKQAENSIMPFENKTNILPANSNLEQTEFTNQQISDINKYENIMN